jgi:anthranilate phosphoribosyltransferase
MSDSQWQEYISVLDSGRDLSVESVQWCMNEILTGQSSDETIKRFLLSLKAKGETPEEISALVSQMYKYASPITITERAVDTVGTGGDGANTINISTTAAIIAAAAGVKVMKHGNRAASSKSGSADLLESLGININLDGKAVETTFSKLGIGFCFAPIFHPAMRFAAAARKELGIPTVFNILGPLANPAQPKAAAIGVANKEMLPVMAQVLAEKGVDGFVFRGDDGIDEITLATTTTVLNLSDGKISSEKFDPSDLKIPRAPISDLRGGDGAHNAGITSAIFDGEYGAPRDAVLLNAAAAIAAYDARFDLNLMERITLGLERATKAVDSGAAKELVRQWVTLSQQLHTAP